jgi:hypothetical protein
MRAALLALLVAAPVAAAELVIDPPAPDTASLIRITLFEQCQMIDPSVTVANKTINIAIRTLPGAGGCVGEFQPYPVTDTIGPLPAGTYDVQLSGKSIKTLVVREATPFTLSPFVVPVTGGTLVRLQRGGLAFPSSGEPSLGTIPSPPTVKVGEQSVKAGALQPQVLYFIAPPGAAGAAADVTLDSRYADQTNTPNLFVARSALVYYDPSRPPDLSVAEPVLFPIAFDGPGAFGSQWRTENTIASRQAGDYTQGFPTFYRPPCAGCSAILTDPKLTLPPMSRPDGLLLWLLRGTEQYASTASVVRDVSRSGNAAISVPVVRGKDFNSAFEIPRIPIKPGSRVTIRLWSVENKPVTVDVTASVSGDGVSTFGEKVLTLIPFSDPQLQFASQDFPTSWVAGSGGPLVPPGANATATLSLVSFDRLLKFWPMVSVTDNDTQQVTIFAPQP